MSSLSFPGKTPNVLDNTGKVDPAMACGAKRLVNFCRLPRAGAAAMHELLAHVLQHGLCRRKGLVVATAHEGERRALGAAGAAGNRRIDRRQAVLGRQRMRLLGAFYVDRRAVDD